MNPNRHSQRRWATLLIQLERTIGVVCVVSILTKTIFYLEIMELRVGEKVGPKRQEERIQEKKN